MCDRVGDYCAPSLYIAGVGKCGTNALSEHLALHPRVARLNREVPWDPRDTPPHKLVAVRHVKPADGRTWVAKHPKYALVTDVTAVARRLRSAYPSARLALTLCDPLTLPWRRFRFLLTTAVTRNGKGAGQVDTLRALAAELRALNSSVSELFLRVFNPLNKGGPCSRAAPRTRHLLDALSREGFGALYGNSWLAPGAIGERKCLQEWRLVSTFTEQVEAWSRALGAVNESVAIVYMERWADGGADSLRTLLRMLRLEESEYPWSKAADAFHRPVYQSGAEVKKLLHSEEGTEEGPPPWVPLEWRPCVQQCARLRRVTGALPPWCREADARVSLVECPRTTGGELVMKPYM